MVLEQMYIDKAKNELREDDLRKSQSLAQFREWIAKHPFLKNVRQGTLKKIFFSSFFFMFSSSSFVSRRHIFATIFTCTKVFYE